MCGEGGIRTPGGCYTPTVFKTVAINRSATSPDCICAEAVGLEPTLQVTPENRLAICCSTNYAYTSEMFGFLIHLCLHYSEENPGPVGLVGKGGLEPPISGVSDRRSNQLNYLPIVSHPGFEPGLLIILLSTRVSPVPSCLCFPIPLVAYDLRHVSWACVLPQLS